MEKSTIQKLISGIKRYLNLQRDFVMLSLAEKLTLVLSMMMVFCVMMILVLLALIFLSMAASNWLETLTGSAACANTIVATFYLLVAIIVYANRHKWVADRVANIIASILIDNDGEDKRDSDI